MKTFKVTFKEVTTKTFEFVAEDKETALEMADGLVCEPDRIDFDKNFDDWSVEIDDIKEVDNG